MQQTALGALFGPLGGTGVHADTAPAAELVRPVPFHNLDGTGRNPEQTFIHPAVDLP
jgi:hypothetical protein